MIAYTQSLDTLKEDMLNGFFAGWPNPPSRQKHIEILKGSYMVWLAVNTDTQQVVGFITSVSDGILCAYIPLLEVLPAYQNRGIGKELVRRMLTSLGNLYMVDLLCDEELQGYYRQLGMENATGAFLRNYARQSCK